MKELFLRDDTLITSKTDTKGKITYGNEDFCYFGGFKGENDFINKPHNIIRHANMPKVAFKLLWDSLKKGEEFFAFVCNLSQKGELYWVFANVTPSYDSNGEVVGYYSVRRRASKKGVEILKDLYSKCQEIEATQNVEAAENYIQNFLQEKNITWNELMIALQKQADTEGYR